MILSCNTRDFDYIMSVLSLLFPMSNPLSLFDELSARWFLNQHSDPAVFAVYDQWGQSFYCGFDPSADSLQLGNFVMFMYAVQFLKRWNTRFPLIGGATWMIGDPSGKDAERTMLSKDQLAHNCAKFHTQFEHLLTNVQRLANLETMDYTLVNNADFYTGMWFLDFLRDVGKHITVNTMMNKETVKKRITDPDKSISYTEFSYMLIQGYDFVHLRKHHNVRLQICGSDQWGNGVTGLELIDKMLGTDDCFVTTAPLILASNGKKFGKSEGNAIWLDPTKNSPFFVHQYFLNTPDSDVEKYLKLFTLYSLDEIAAIVAMHQQQPERRTGQKILADYLVRLIFDDESLARIERLTPIVFGSWDVADRLAWLHEGDKQALLDATWWCQCNSFPIRVADLCVMAGLVWSNKEAKTDCQAGAITINGTKYTDATQDIDTTKTINGILLLKKWKKTVKTVLCTHR